MFLCYIVTFSSGLRCFLEINNNLSTMTKNAASIAKGLAVDAVMLKSRQCLFSEKCNYRGYFSSLVFYILVEI